MQSSPEVILLALLLDARRLSLREALLVERLRDERGRGSARHGHGSKPIVGRLRGDEKRRRTSKSVRAFRATRRAGAAHATVTGAGAPTRTLERASKETVGPRDVPWLASLERRRGGSGRRGVRSRAEERASNGQMCETKSVFVTFDHERRMNGDPPHAPRVSSRPITSPEEEPASRSHRVTVSTTPSRRLRHTRTRGSGSSPSGCHRVSTETRARRAALRLLARDVRRRHVRDVRREQHDVPGPEVARPPVDRFRNVFFRNVFFRSEDSSVPHVTSFAFTDARAAAPRGASRFARRATSSTAAASSVSQPERAPSAPAADAPYVRRTPANVASACDPAATISAPSATRTSPSGIQAVTSRPEPPPPPQEHAVRVHAGELAPRHRAQPLVRGGHRETRGWVRGTFRTCRVFASSLCIESIIIIIIIIIIIGKQDARRDVKQRVALGDFLNLRARRRRPGATAGPARARPGAASLFLFLKIHPA